MDGSKASGVSLIVAIGEDGSIGKNGELIWKISEDLKRFKKLTTGHPVIMGRKTWESLPKRPLPHRRNIVLTRNKDYVAEGGEVTSSIEEALDMTRGESPFIIGGSEIYKAFMPYITDFHITKVFDKCRDADTFLELPDNIELVWESPVYSESDLKYQFRNYQAI